jgi:uncharacterized membrane protein YiaA
MLLSIIIAILLPLILGVLSCNAIYVHSRTNDQNAPSIIPLLLGYGYIIGIFITTIILRLWDAIELKLAFIPISSILIILSIIIAISLPKTAWLNWNITYYNVKFNHTYLVNLILLILISTRFIALVTEIWLSPLYPWDAWFAWGQKTSTWFELRQLIPFAAPSEWPGTVDSPIFTAPAFAYPPTIPLIQVWTLLGIGQWDDALMNFAWLICPIALGLGMYGQARQWGIKPTHALFWIYLLLSLPLLNVHIALAGYADLWLATGYAFTIMALLSWIYLHQPFQIWFAIFAAVFTIATKTEGIAWIATLLPAIFIAIGFKPNLILKLIASVIIGLSVVYLLSPLELSLPEIGQLIIRNDLLQLPGISPLPLKQNNINWQLIRHLFMLNNWNLLWLIIISTLFIGIWYIRNKAELIAAYLIIGANIAFLSFMFGYTEFGKWAENATILNRLILHLVPGIIFMCIIIEDYFLGLDN